MGCWGKSSLTNIMFSDRSQLQWTTYWVSSVWNNWPWEINKDRKNISDCWRLGALEWDGEWQLMATYFSLMKSTKWCYSGDVWKLGCGGCYITLLNAEFIKLCPSSRNFYLLILCWELVLEMSLTSQWHHQVSVFHMLHSQWKLGEGPCLWWILRDPSW